MKCKFTFKLKEPLTLPKSYNYILQSSLLSWINEDGYSKFIHDEGYKTNNRTYKLYTFSHIYGKNTRNNYKHIITFYDEIYFYISSYDNKFIKYLIQNMITDTPIKINKTNLNVEAIQTINDKVEEECIVNTLSPITMYSTFTTAEGAKKTYYYSPNEKEFSELLRKNLIKKYIAFNEKEPVNNEFKIEPIRNIKEIKSLYKGFIIKGWSGCFKLSGSKELIEIALGAGLGGKNSQGYGYIIAEKE